MSVNVGTRPGTKPEQKIQGWDYVLGQGTNWDAIRKDDREVRRYEAAVSEAAANLEKALIAVNIAHVLLHGGHVDKGKMSLAGVRPDMGPGEVLNHAQRLLPPDLAGKALK